MKQGCEYCINEKDLSGWEIDVDVWIKDGELYVSAGGYRTRIHINYCPMCGRKLKGVSE